MFLFVVFVVLLTDIAADSGYEAWSDLNSNKSVADASKNDTLCLAEKVVLTTPMNKLELVELNCAKSLVVLVVNHIGLSVLTSESISQVPATVRNLSLAGNNLDRIEAGIFSNRSYESLNFTMNKINDIAPSAFDNMTNLTSIILDDNQLTVYNITFLQCPHLKLISLKRNFLKRLTDGMLKHLKTNILSIYLSNNQIKEVSRAALDVKQFQQVHLDHNELANAVLLIKLVKADLLDLSENKITCLPKEFMENGLSKIKMLNLTGNPLECACLQDLKRKLRKNVEFQKMSPLVQHINIVLPKDDGKPCETTKKPK